MKFPLNRLITNKRLLNHLIFWGACTFVLTLIYGLGLPNYFVAFNVILMILPVQMVYFYVVCYYIIPKYLYNRKYIKLALAFLCCAIISALLFRTIEIFFADPYIQRVCLARDPSFVWPKLEGTVKEQFLKTNYIINAIEQSNTIIWVTISLKFYKMWTEKKQVALQAELNFLKGQIHPHFLFNTLNNLYALTLKQSAQSPTIVLGLSDILRYMLYECKTETVPLLRDVEILESYVSLEKLRYGDRLDLTLSITGNLSNYNIAPLLMIPIVENAFKHGTSEMVIDSWINIDISVIDKRFKLKVSNSKPLVKKINYAELHFGNIGLRNVKKRLELLYKDTHKFNIYDEEDMFVAILEIELNKDSESLKTKNHNHTQTT